MLQRDKWPFTPDRLSDIIDSETLAVIQAGCVARLRSSMTILEPNPISNPVFPQEGRVDPINLLEESSLFCSLLRNKRFVTGGNEACEACDRAVANQIFNNPQAPAFKTYPCHIGVLDARHLVYVLNRPVAVLFAGQFKPSLGTDKIQANVKQLGHGNWKHIQVHDEKTRQELLNHVEELHSVPDNFTARLQREAEHIGRLAEGQYLAQKHRWEQEFRDKLRNIQGYGNINDIQDVRALATKFLIEIKQFTRCKYMILFVSTQEGDTVLVPIAQVGIDPQMEEQLPHFNWRKAFNKDNAIYAESNTLYQHQQSSVRDPSSHQGEQRQILTNGIRGDNSGLFANATFAATTTLGRQYRSVLIFGPFAEPVDINGERDFLAEVGRIIGWAILSELQVLNLQQKHREWRHRAKLLTHQLRTTITPITTHIGAAKMLLPTATHDVNLKSAAKHIEVAQTLCLQLGRAVAPALDSHVLLVERDDLSFEPYPLSVLVANCAVGFDEWAQQHQRQIIVDEGVEQLPSVEIDVARMMIALSNIIENALKYSFPGTKIYIRAGRAGGQLDLVNTIIEIQDEGDEIPADQVDKIFQPGTRLLTDAKMQRIPGSGLGLWEARAVIDAHNGRIQVTTAPSNYIYRQVRAQRVTFRVSLPRNQEN